MLAEPMATMDSLAQQRTKAFIEIGAVDACETFDGFEIVVVAEAAVDQGFDTPDASGLIDELEQSRGDDAARRDFGRNCQSPDAPRSRGSGLAWCCRCTRRKPNTGPFPNNRN
jgi:hypothetical protein